MTVKEIVIAYCIVHCPEANGLCIPNTCGCSFEQMQNCGTFCMNCVPAKWSIEEEEFQEIKEGGYDVFAL